MTDVILAAQTTAELDSSWQTTIRLPLPIVEGNKDYRERESLLHRMNAVLEESGVEAEFVASRVAAEVVRLGRALTARRRATVQHHARQTIRCTIARILSGESHRAFSCHVAESPLLQWFCACTSLPTIKVPSKSSLQRMEKLVCVDQLRSLVARLIQASSQTGAGGSSLLGLAEAVDLSVVWMDSTCAKLDMHFPTDWALLRDGVRSVMRSIAVIRVHGIRHRMPAPESIISEINTLAMAMSAASRRGRGGDKKRERKKTLRTMKKLVRKVQRHGQRYRDRLLADWPATDLSEAEAAQIVRRIDHILGLMPQAVKQAHERIIGKRVVPTCEKILSLYQPHAQVYVRGKSGADTEFGLQMLLTESAEGLIVDCQLTDDRVAADTALLMPALERIRAIHGNGSATTVVTDRGFASAKNSERLNQAGITDHTCPRSPDALARRAKDPIFRRLQKRRAQTEGRIGLFKANFLGNRIPTKSREAQHRFVAWSALAHNLWVLARLEQANAASSAA